MCRSRVEATDRHMLALIYDVYSRLEDYKQQRYGAVLAGSEAELRRRYVSAANGNGVEPDGLVKIKWDLYNIHADRFILLSAAALVSAVSLGFGGVWELSRERLEAIAAHASAAFGGLFRSLGIRSAAAMRRELQKALAALGARDYSAYLAVEDAHGQPALARYRTESAAGLLERIEQLSAAAMVSPAEDRQRSAQLVNLLKSYYMRACAENGTLRCECCGEEAFITAAGEPYVEFHHLIPFGIAYGPDHYLNLFALCPSCHRRLHFQAPADKHGLYSRAQRRELPAPQLCRAPARPARAEPAALLSSGVPAGGRRHHGRGIRQHRCVRCTILELKDIRHQIFNARADELLPEFPADSVDLVVTSPPYDDLRDYQEGAVWNFEVFKAIARELYRVVKPGGVVVWVVGDKTANGGRSPHQLPPGALFPGARLQHVRRDDIRKAGSGPPHPNRYFNAFEYMFVLSRGRPATVHLLRDKPNRWAGYTTYGDVTRREKDGSLTNKGKKTVNEFGVRTNVWRYANGRGFSTRDKIAYEHPAIFPEKLAADHIATWSDPGDLVLDPFGGSGTTAKMAQLMGREWGSHRAR